MSCIFSPALQVVSVAGAIKKGSVVVSVGTKKGGFIFHSPDRRKWTMAGPYVPGATVYHFILDPRDGRTAYAAAPHGSEPGGPAVYRGRAGEALDAASHEPNFTAGSRRAAAAVTAHSL